MIGAERSWEIPMRIPLIALFLLCAACNAEVANLKAFGDLNTAEGFVNEARWTTVLKQIVPDLTTDNRASPGATIYTGLANQAAAAATAPKDYAFFMFGTQEAQDGP